MRILLSPLFFQQSMCKHCVRIYYSNHPDNWLWQYELERMPPLGQYDPQSGFLPDYPLLVMFDEFVMGEESYDRLQFRSGEDWLGDWPEVIDLLRSEGALGLVDVHSTLKQKAHARGWMLRRDMEHPRQWTEALRYYRSLMAEAHEAFGTKPNESDPVEWRFDPERFPVQPGPDGKGHILSAIPDMEEAQDPSDPHSELLRVATEVMKSHLREVNAGLAVSRELNVAPMFWAPYRRYLEQKGEEARAVVQQQDRVQAARQFFEVAFPRFRPDSVADLKSLRRDSRLRSLRDEIDRAATSGAVLDPDYPQRILEEVLKIQQQTERMRTISAWLSAAVGLVPGVGSAATAVGEGVAKHLESRMKQDLDWLYLISDGTGHT